MSRGIRGLARKTLNRRRDLALMAIAAATATAQARPPRGTLDGIVTDTSLTPLANATVSLLGSRIHTITGDNGRFRIIALPAGEHILVVQRIGYAPLSAVIQVDTADTLRASYALQPIVRPLDTMVVTAAAYAMRMAGFEERRTVGFGHFLTQADIEGRHALSVADLLQPALSVRIVYGGSMRMFERYAYSMRSGCPLTVFVDDVQLPTPTNLDDLPPPHDIAGIEIYSGAATLPLQYKPTSGGCGAILVWTK